MCKGHCEGDDCCATDCTSSGEYKRRLDPKYKYRAERKERRDSISSNIYRLLSNLAGAEYYAKLYIKDNAKRAQAIKAIEQIAEDAGFRRRFEKCRYKK